MRIAMTEAVGTMDEFVPKLHLPRANDRNEPKVTDAALFTNAC